MVNELSFAHLFNLPYTLFLGILQIVCRDYIWLKTVLEPEAPMHYSYNHVTTHHVENVGYFVQMATEKEHKILTL